MKLMLLIVEPSEQLNTISERLFDLRPFALEL